MPAIGIALVWAGYTVGLWGYMLVKGYDVTMRQLLSSEWPPPNRRSTAAGPPQTPGGPRPIPQK